MAVLQRECSRPLPDVQGVRPTQLFSRNVDVDRVNGEEMTVGVERRSCAATCSFVLPTLLFSWNWGAGGCMQGPCGMHSIYVQGAGSQHHAKAHRAM